jgi:hypothetical protein
MLELIVNLVQHGKCYEPNPNKVAQLKLLEAQYAKHKKEKKHNRKK